MKKNNNIDVFDNLVDKNLLAEREKIKLITKINKKNFYDVIVISVPHKRIRSLKINFLKTFCKKSGIIIDIKSIYSKKQVEWQL